jgi:hypothetical protein
MNTVLCHACSKAVLQQRWCKLEQCRSSCSVSAARGRISFFVAAYGGSTAVTMQHGGLAAESTDLDDAAC